MIVSFTDQKNGSHIKEMDHGEGEHDLARHGTNAYQQLCPGDNGIPAPQHQGRITQVQQVIARQQNAVDKVGQLYILLQQVQDKQPAVPVEKQAHPDGNEISNKQIEDVG